MHETNNSQSVFSLCALLRAFDGNLLRHEHGALRGSTRLRGGDAELKLALIELIDAGSWLPDSDRLNWVI